MQGFSIDPIIHDITPKHSAWFNNDGTIVKAPRSTDLFRNSIATPSLVASILNGKYNNALPLERQSRAYKSNGINLATNTMANWVIKSAENYLSLLYDRLHKLIYENTIIHADLLLILSNHLEIPPPIPLLMKHT